MKSIEFAKVLRSLNVLTPITDQFENERDEKGVRKYGQKNNRWWDYSTGSLKEHLKLRE